MTTPPMDSNVPDAPITKPAKPGVPRAVLLGGALAGLAAVGAVGFYVMQQNSGGDDAAGGETPAPVVTAPSPRPRPAPTPKPTVVANAGKAQAAQALGAFGDRRIRLETSFDNVPTILGGDGKRVYPPTPIPATDNGKKPKPVVQGRLPLGLRSDPFVSRLIVPIAREFAYTLAVPYRLAPPAKPPVLKRSEQLPPEIALGPLPYVPRRVAGFLEYGGVSAILESGQFGGGSIEIVQPGSTVASGLAGIPNLTVESISNTEMVLRAVDGRSTRVALSGVPGGIPATGAGVGGGPPGFPGAPGRPGRGEGGARGGGGGATSTQ